MSDPATPPASPAEPRRNLARRDRTEDWDMRAATPPALIEPCIKAGSRPGDTVLDPFGGAGTTGLVADRLGRSAVLIELNPEYAGMAKTRITDDAPLFAEVST